MKKIIVCLMIFSIIIPFASAGLQDIWGRLTGKATSQPVELQILIGGGNIPIINVFNNSMTDVSIGPNEAPVSTPITITFQASDPEGRGNLNDSTAEIQFLKAGETTRKNSCTPIPGESDSISQNFTCNVEMFWWDSPGTWEILAKITDLNGNLASDQNKTFLVGSTAGFVAYPLSVAWNEINPGSQNIPANNSIVLNNTGNLARNIEMNSTNLVGISDNTKALYSGNFSLNTISACEGTLMQHLSFTQIAGSNLPRGNYTINDRSTGQEELFFCLELAGSELTQQIYSTQEEGAWTIKITA